MLICLVETHLHKEEEIMIPGYGQIFHNDRSANSGDIMVNNEGKSKHSYIRGFTGKGNWAKLVDVGRWQHIGRWQQK